MSTEATKDIYSRVTDRILADLAKGVRPWVKPWNAEDAAGRIIRPLRHNGTPYKGINIPLLWGEVYRRRRGLLIARVVDADVQEGSVQAVDRGRGRRDRGVLRQPAVRRLCLKAEPGVGDARPVIIFATEPETSL